MYVLANYIWDVYKKHGGKEGFNEYFYNLRGNIVAESKNKVTKRMQ